MQFILPILQVIFIVAKVFAIDPVAAWSWWTVFLPMLIPLGIVVACAIVATGIVIIDPGARAARKAGKVTSPGRIHL